MAQMRTYAFALLLAIGLLGCGGSEYRFGNSQRSLTSISVTPSSQSLTAAGQTAQFIATGTFSSDPLSQDLTSQAQWSSSTPSVSTVSSSGLATAVATGTSTITASLNGVVGSANVTVDSSESTRSLTSMTVIPGGQALGVIGETAQYIAIGNFTSSPTTQDMTNQVTWSSSDVRVATINSAGLATAIGSVDGGETTITAISPPSSGVAVTGTASLTVASNGTNQLPTLTVYEFGQGTGIVQSFDSSWAPDNIIKCGSGAGCTGHYALNATVILTASTPSGTEFGGFSANCHLLIPDPNPLTQNPNYCVKEEGVPSCTCQLGMSDNVTVGAIFDLAP